MSDKRFVFDTNVLVSAVLMPQSIPRQALDAALTQGFVLFSKATFAELRDVLARPKLKPYLTTKKIAAFLRLLKKTTKWVEPTQTFTACRDPKDNKFLDIAVSGQADYLISGDGDLQDLNPFQGIPIISPAEFLAQIKPRI